MKNYRRITPEEFNNSPFKLIGKDWLLITAKDDTKKSGANAMTASWGGLGILWNKPVATIYIRPQRYTYSLTENENEISLCVLGEEYRKALGYLGSHSGRDSDKIADLGLNTEKIDDVPVIVGSEIVMICKKLYADDLKEENFIEKENLSHYDGDFHRFYILEIKEILVKES